MAYRQTASTGRRGPGDRSVVFLLLSNLFTILLALYQQWDVGELMWVYWGRSVVIGYFNVHRILDLRRFSTEGFTINNRPVKPTRKTRRDTAVFFALHYGFLHFACLVFLVNDTQVQVVLAWAGVAVCVFAFYLNHRFSYRYNREREEGRVPNIGSIMFFRYVRIIPMHLMIVAGSRLTGESGKGLLVFLLLKTVADVAMHVIEHAMARAAAQRARERLS
jgi:hypothetical protein